MRSNGMRWRRRGAAAAILAASLALVASGCSSSGSGSSAKGATGAPPRPGRRRGRGQVEHGQDPDHVAGLRAQAGQRARRGGRVRHHQLGRGRGNRGRAAHQRQGPHPGRAGEPHARPVRRLLADGPAGHLQGQLPGGLAAGLDVQGHRDGDGPRLAEQPAAHVGRAGLRDLRQAEHRRPGHPHPVVLQGDQLGQHEPGQAALHAGPDVLREDRAGGRGLGQPGHQHRRPLGEPGHGEVPVHRLPPDRADALAGQEPATARPRCARSWSRTSSS